MNLTEYVWKEEQKLSDKLEQTRSLLERLHQTQYERLSGPLPQHLAQISPISEAEHILGKLRVFWFIFFFHVSTNSSLLQKKRRVAFFEVLKAV